MYEYSCTAGTLRLIEDRGRWRLDFAGRRAGHWESPDLAAKAVAQHQSGLQRWDHQRIDAPEDLLDWRPLGKAL